MSPYVLGNFGDVGEFIFLAIQLAMPWGSFFAGWVSDFTKHIRALLLLGLVFLVPIQFLLFSFPEDWVLTCILGATQRFLLSANYQWLVIATIEVKGEGSFSKNRATGTFGFLFIQLVLYLVSIPVVGLISTPALAGKLGAFAYLFCVPLALFFPRYRHSKEVFQWNEAIQYLKNGRFLRFFGLAFFFYFAYQITDNYMGRYIQISYGLDSVFLAWMIAVLWEIPFLLAIPFLVRKYGNRFLFIVSLIAGGLRFSLFALSAVGFPKWLVLSFQVPHAILFAGFYMGGIYWFRKNSPPHIYGSIYGLYSILAVSLGGVLGNLSCGYLLRNHWGSKILSFWEISFPDQRGDFGLLFFFCACIFWILLSVVWRSKETV